MKKSTIHFIILGLVFLLVEYIFRCVTYNTDTFRPALLMMFFVGGLSGLYLGMINENQAINKNVNIFWQSIIGAIVILLIELISGIILNLWLHMGIWDYSTLPCNVLGQICLPFAFGWLLLCPFGFWLDDMIRSYLYKDKIAPYTIKQIYARAWNPFDKPFI